MNFAGLTNIGNFLKNQSMEAQWKQKSRIPSSGIVGDPSGGSIPETAKSDPKISSIINKMNLGDELSPEELEYLRDYAPQLYDEAVKAISEKRGYEKELRNCKTKNEVHTLQMHKVAAAFSKMKGGGAQGAPTGGLAADAKLKLLTKAYLSYISTKEFAQKAVSAGDFNDTLKALEKEKNGKAAKASEKPSPMSENNDKPAHMRIAAERPVVNDPRTGERDGRIPSPPEGARPEVGQRGENGVHEALSAVRIDPHTEPITKVDAARAYSAQIPSPTGTSDAPEEKTRRMSMNV